MVYERVTMRRKLFTPMPDDPKQPGYWVHYERVMAGTRFMHSGIWYVRGGAAGWAQECGPDGARGGRRSFPAKTHVFVQDHSGLMPTKPALKRIARAPRTPPSPRNSRTPLTEGFYAVDLNDEGEEIVVMSQRFMNVPIGATFHRQGRLAKTGSYVKTSRQGAVYFESRGLEVDQISGNELARMVVPE